MRVRHTRISRGNGPFGRRPANRRSRRHTPQMEPLEDRRLLSNIVWIKPQSELQRRLRSERKHRPGIDRQAIQDWEQLIVDSAFTKVGQPGYAPQANTLDLRFVLTDTPAGEPSALDSEGLLKDRELS